MIFRAGHLLTATGYIPATIIGSILCFVAGYALAHCWQR